jgi:hypothetical protein
LIHPCEGYTYEACRGGVAGHCLIIELDIVGIVVVLIYAGAVIVEKDVACDGGLKGVPYRTGTAGVLVSRVFSSASEVSLAAGVGTLAQRYPSIREVTGSGRVACDNVGLGVVVVVHPSPRQGF